VQGSKQHTVIVRSKQALPFIAVMELLESTVWINRSEKIIIFS